MQTRVAPVAVLAIMGAAHAQDFVTVEVADQYNSTAAGYNAPDTLPTGLNVYAGVPFEMPASNDPDAPYAWNAAYEPPTNPVILEIPVGVDGVDVAYTIMNTYWGVASGGFIAVEFVGSDGAFESYDLVGNDDIRDFNNGAFTNVINGTTTIEVFNNGIGQRLDRQAYDLGEDFLDETLETIRIVDNGAEGLSRAFIVAATVQSGCAADCNGDGVLNILDFVCFQGLFVAGSLDADCNGDGQLNVLDFVCFQQVFVEGCG